jgi:hypothetical protein
MFRLHYGQELQSNSANRDGIHESLISLRFLGIILSFLRLEVSTYVFVFLPSAIHET